MWYDEGIEVTEDGTIQGSDSEVLGSTLWALDRRKIGVN